VTGWYADPCLCAAHGFLFSAGSHTTVDVPGFGSTYGYGINNSSQVVGATQPGFGTGGDHGFLLSGGGYSLVDHPDAAVGDALGINDLGDIVGYYYDGSNNLHGYVFSGGTFSTVDHPAATATEALGNNSQGQIVGAYNDSSGQLHGFVATLVTMDYVASIRPPINADGSSVFNAKRGVVPVKFVLTVGGTPTCDLPPATISVFRTAGGTLGQVNETVYLQSSDSGSNFRISDCQYVYNLGSSGLGSGTYEVRISIEGTVVGTASFSLK
jgi:hypothetical protein